MNTHNVERNNRILELFNEGLSSSRVKDKLVEEGYGEITRSRVWSIYKASTGYRFMRKVEKFCNFCQTNKSIECFNFVRDSRNRQLGRICLDCTERLLKVPSPEQEEKLDL